ncbi:YwdI family protein [Chryseomicrobium sp. FSL W7-1435]|uniref:YwdI family protein n=1 Tax=Chryseomicrobium sp. FSL W7-1435 TaxID=2921704 RepID=UPI00315A51D9
MISYQQVAAQLQTYTQRLQVATTDAERRECFAAIRALCDIGLATAANTMPAPSPVTYAEASPASSPVAPPSVPLSGERFKEDDANGDSLFDF